MVSDVSAKMITRRIRRVRLAVRRIVGQIRWQLPARRVDRRLEHPVLPRQYSAEVELQTTFVDPSCWMTSSA